MMPSNSNMEVLTGAEMFSLLYFIYFKYHYTFHKMFPKTSYSVIESVIEAPKRMWMTAISPARALDEIIYFVLTGSMSEGTAVGSSDFDIMIVLKCLQCCEPGLLTVYEHQGKGLFVADKVNASPGYVLMLGYETSFPRTHDRRFENINLETFGEFRVPVANKILGNTLLVTMKSFFASSEQFSKGIKVIGPATNLFVGIVKSYFASVDWVFAVPYEERALLESWARRNRQCNWPSAELISKVLNMSGHLVPVGRKGSPLEQYEWRIFYTLAERELMRSLNEVQLLLYKRIKLQCKGEDIRIPSYVIKNLIMWQAETLPHYYFQEKYYFALEYATMATLAWCLKNNALPSYMTPERNLIADKLTEEEKRAILKKLNDYLAEYYYGSFLASLMKIRSNTMFIKLLNFSENLREGKRENFVKQYQDRVHKKTLEWKKTDLIYCNILNGPAVSRFTYTLRLCPKNRFYYILPEIMITLLMGCIKIAEKFFARKFKVHVPIMECMYYCPC